MIAAWCELRAAFRTFRTERIWGFEVLEDTFTDQAETLRALYLEERGY